MRRPPRSRIPRLLAGPVLERGIQAGPGGHGSRDDVGSPPRPTGLSSPARFACDRTGLFFGQPCETTKGKEILAPTQTKTSLRPEPPPSSAPKTASWRSPTTREAGRRPRIEHDREPVLSEGNAGHGAGAVRGDPPKLGFASSPRMRCRVRPAPRHYRARVGAGFHGRVLEPVGRAGREDRPLGVDGLIVSRARQLRISVLPRRTDGKPETWTRSISMT